MLGAEERQEERDGRPGREVSPKEDEQALLGRASDLQRL